MKKPLSGHLHLFAERVDQKGAGVLPSASQIATNVMVVAGLECGACGRYCEDDDIVQYMNDDCREQAVFEHQPEHYHADEPGIDHVEPAVTFVCFPELTVRTDDGRSDRPACWMIEVFLKCSEGSKVRYRDEQ